MVQSHRGGGTHVAKITPWCSCCLLLGRTVGDRLGTRLETVTKCLPGSPCLTELPPPPSLNSEEVIFR